MDMIVVAVMAVVMVGAAIWCWRIENLPGADEKKENSERGGHKA